MHAPAIKVIPAETLLLAYRSGIFPMADRRDDPDVFWVEPKLRAILPLDGFRCSRSLAKVIRQERFTVTVNHAFAEVLEACAAPRPNHPESWISERIAASYRVLHLAGYAHSVECWQDGALVGGLYGVSFDRVFCGESMFSKTRDSSKVALAWLVALLRRAGAELLDCQFMTEHLESMGAVEITQQEYLRRLRVACAPGPEADLPAAYVALLAEAEGVGAGAGDGAAEGLAAGSGVPLAEEGKGASSPGKLIAHSLTQTS